MWRSEQRSLIQIPPPPPPSTYSWINKIKTNRGLPDPPTKCTQTIHTVPRWHRRLTLRWQRETETETETEIETESLQLLWSPRPCSHAHQKEKKEWRKRGGEKSTRNNSPYDFPHCFSFPIAGLWCHHGSCIMFGLMDHLHMTSCWPVSVHSRHSTDGARWPHAMTKCAFIHLWWPF